MRKKTALSKKKPTLTEDSPNSARPPTRIALRRHAASQKAQNTEAQASGDQNTEPNLPAHATCSKQAALIKLLKADDGATLAQITKLTGWQPHTIRGVISGVLRKKLNLNVVTAKSADGGGRVYRIVASDVGTSSSVAAAP